MSECEACKLVILDVKMVNEEVGQPLLLGGYHHVRELHAEIERLRGVGYQMYGFALALLDCLSAYGQPTSIRREHLERARCALTESSTERREG